MSAASGRRLPPARVIEIVAGKSRAPLLQDLREPYGLEICHHLVLVDVGETLACQGRLPDQVGVAEHERSLARRPARRHRVVRGRREGLQARRAARRSPGWPRPGCSTRQPGISPGGSFRAREEGDCCAGRRPPASKNRTTAGRGPVPSCATRSVVQGPSGVFNCKWSSSWSSPCQRAWAGVASRRPETARGAACGRHQARRRPTGETRG